MTLNYSSEERQQECEKCTWQTRRAALPFVLGVLTVIIIIIALLGEAAFLASQDEGD